MPKSMKDILIPIEGNFMILYNYITNFVCFTELGDDDDSNAVEDEDWPTDPPVPSPDLIKSSVPYKVTS